MKVRTLYSAIILLMIAPSTGLADDGPGWPRFAPGSPSAIQRVKAHDGCPGLPERLQVALSDARAFGTVLIRSTCGGQHASNSAHYSGEAVDFRVEGNCSAVHARFADWNGGYNRIDQCLFHLDVREKRRW